MSNFQFKESINDVVFNKIIYFVEEQRWKYDFTLERTTKIEYDLGITGDDAIEFMIAYGKEFNVDVSNFMAANYFEPEGMNWLLPKSAISKKELTLGDLEKGIIAGRLDEEIIS